MTLEKDGKRRQLLGSYFDDGKWKKSAEFKTDNSEGGFNYDLSSKDKQTGRMWLTMDEQSALDARGSYGNGEGSLSLSGGDLDVQGGLELRRTKRATFSIGSKTSGLKYSLDFNSTPGGFTLNIGTPKPEYETIVAEVTYDLTSARKYINTDITAGDRKVSTRLNARAETDAADLTFKIETSKPNVIEFSASYNHEHPTTSYSLSARKTKRTSNWKALQPVTV